MPKKPIRNDVKAVDDKLLFLGGEVVGCGEYGGIVAVLVKPPSNGVDVERHLCVLLGTR